MQGENALHDLDKALEVFQIEQFVQCLPVDLHRWIIERKPSSLMVVEKLADE